MAFEAIFGPSLLGQDGQSLDTTAALAGKVVGIYFSAHWCPPCRGFTPKLVELYNELKKAGKPFEIVFASSDRDEGSFNEYFGEMPWLSLPFADRERKNKLSQKHKVKGIPSLVILDESGETITEDGRTAASGDDAVATFPWKPPTLEEMCSGPIEKAGGEATSFEALRAEGKHIGLYFSAHWCPPCRGFTPTLAQAYTNVVGKNVPFEIVFVSSDKDQGQCDEYFASMPWARLPFSDRSKKEALSNHFGVQGIPSFVMLDSSLGVVNKSARGAVSGDVKGESFPWAPPPFNDLEGPEGPEGINDTPSVLSMCEMCDDGDQADVETALTAAAKQPENKDVLFFVCKGEGRVGPQVRKLCKLGKPKDEPQHVLLDLADSGAFYAAPEGASIADLIAGWRGKTLERQTVAQ